MKIKRGFTKNKPSKEKGVTTPGSLPPMIEKEEEEKKTLKTFLKDFPKVSKAGYRLMKYVFKKSPGYTLLFIITSILFSILPFINTWIGSLVIDELIKILASQNTGLRTLYLLIGWGVVISILDNLTDILNVIANTNIWFKVGRDLQHDFTKKFAYLDYEYYDDPEMNDKINKVRQNFQAHPQRFTESLLSSLESVTTIISATAIFIVFSPIIIFLMLVSSIPVLIVNMAYSRRSWGIWNAKGDVSRDFWWTESYLQNDRTLMELKIFGIRKYLLNRMMNVYDNFQKSQLAIDNKRNIVVFLLSLLRLVGRTTAYLLIVLAVIGAEITIGQFNFYIQSVGRLQEGFGTLLRRVADLYEHGLYIVDLFEFLDLPEKLKPGEVCLTSEKPPKIEFKETTFSYPTKETTIKALDSINLTIEPGEHIAIVGENGAGKTTLIKLLMRFYDTTNGHILINGINIKDLDIDSWYTHVGVLFQDFNFYHFTAKENIGVGDVSRLDDFDNILKASEDSGADDFIKEYEYKYEQMMDKQFKHGITPSTGQRQRIALARAFFKNAPILILDEPTSAIDPKAEYEIFQHLFRFAKGKTVIIISHRFSTVRNANRIVVLDKGKIVEMGNHEDLMSISGGKYKTAFELQRKGYI
ncbi:ABC transporter ATP-binding protein [Patescibacteria group bacterium]|nr:ABC transporter ATP-binding protein [Patescibacteria group bacterium]